MKRVFMYLHNILSKYINAASKISSMRFIKNTSKYRKTS
jgi:hypothetical protein